MFTIARRAASAAVGILAFAGVAPAQHDMKAMASAEMPGALGISMNRMGSGTTWIPDAVSLPSRHVSTGQWTMMLHGYGFLQYDYQSGARGDRQFGSLNWAMLMASRPLAGGFFQARTMLSLDPWTVTGSGYPLLLQSGEMHNGAPIIDRQHPHDFWMELGVLYERPLASNVGVSLYGGPSGEPALGPVAFMHRPSAVDDPFAPLGHHSQDATHITYGVATLGVFTRQWKLEGSWFNGREPDDKRFTMDPMKLDSYSARLTVNPNANWSATVGYGYLASPEAIAPDESVRRIVSSAMYGRAVGDTGQWSATAVFGANREAQSWMTSWLLESELELARHTLFGRAELVERTAGEMQLLSGGVDERFRVASVSLGYIRALHRSLGLGLRGTVHVLPEIAESTYGSKFPMGAVVFLRARPARRGMAKMPM